jgi:hypothetical protein
MRLTLAREEDGAGNQTVEEVPLSSEKLDMWRSPDGQPAFRLDFKEGFWEVTGSRHVGLDQPPPSPNPYMYDGSPHVKRLDEEHRSFQLHFSCGEKLYNEYMKFTIILTNKS